MNKPLAKALHTVTVVVAVAAEISRHHKYRNAEATTNAALAVLGYERDQWEASPELFAKCVAAVKKMQDAK